MKFLALALSFFGTIAAQDFCENEGFWGKDCNYLCGSCKEGNKCKKDNGACFSDDAADKTRLCATGWTGNTCSEPLCDGVADCGPMGYCVRPNECVCTKLWSQSFVEGKRAGCYSLRVSGLKGAGIAVCVLIASIFACKAGHKFSQH